MDLTNLKKALQLMTHDALVEQQDNKTIITSCDGITSFSFKIPEVFPTFIATSPLRGFLTTLSEAEITVEGAVRVTHAKGYAEFPVLDPAYYQNINGFIPTHSFVIDAEELKKIFSLGYATDNQLETLAGVWLTPKGAIASNRILIARYRTELLQTTPVCVPQADRIVKSFHGSVRVEVGSAIRFIGENFDYTTRVLDTKLPNFDKYKFEYNINALIDRDTLIESIRRLSFTQDSVLFAFGKKLILSTQTSKEEYDISTFPYEMYFDGREVLSALTRLSPGEITLAANPYLCLKQDNFETFILGKVA